MASRAPFGTDLQAKFDVRVVAGKLIRTPLSTSNSIKPKTRDTSISGAVQAHKQLKQARGHVNMDSQREGVGRPRSKRARSLDILPILEEGLVEPLEEPSPLKVANTAQTQVKTSRSKSNVNLPSIVVIQQSNNRQFSTVNEEISTAKLQIKEVHILVENLFKPVVNKMSIVEDIKRSCNRADKAHFGVLNKEMVLNTFKSYGIKISKQDLSKLCELIPCSIGEEHIQYDKLCNGLEQILSEKVYSVENNNPNSPPTPLGSIDSESPDSVTDFDLDCILPRLGDRTNLLHRSLPLESPNFHKPRRCQSLTTHPLSLSHNKNTIKLPPVSEIPHNLNKTNSSPPKTKASPVCRLSTKAPWPLDKEQENGVEKMYNALRSCTDSDGESPCV